MNEPWTLYPQLRDRVMSLARSMSVDELATVVPLTPGWTTSQVVAHVCGLNADVVGGAREGLGTDERTAAQVSARSERSIGEVCDEWIGYDDAMRAVAAGIPLLEERLAADLVIHLHDMQHALGLAIDETDDATLSAAHVYAMRSPERWSGLTNINVSIELTDGYRAEPSGDTDVVLGATPYDFLRSVSGRRSRRQVEALSWSAPADLILDNFSPYAALGDVDAPI